MADDRLEFLISQYLDGDLPPADRDALEQRLANDVEAQQALETYRRLDRALKDLAPMPAVDWDALAERISRAVADEADRAAAPIPLYGSLRRSRRYLAVAASILLAAGIGLGLYLADSRPPAGTTPTAGTTVARIDVQGPRPESTDAPAVQIVTIQPAPALEQISGQWHAAESIIARPSRVLIASGSDSAQDMNWPLR